MTREIWRTTRLVTLALMLAACGDDDTVGASMGESSPTSSPASTGAASDPSAGSSGTATGPMTSGTATDGSSTSAGPATSSSTDTDSTTDSTSDAPTSDAPTTDAPTTDTSTSTGAPATTGTSTGEPLEPPMSPDGLGGCASCECCDPWDISWSPVDEATYYEVLWKCSINPEQTYNVGNVSSVADLCNDVEMCNGMCVFTVGYVRVRACNENGCSAPVDLPDIPISCGGGCCC